MACVLLWHVNTHFLYRCSHNITCQLIDHSLYICNAPLLQTTTSVEKTDTTSIPPEVSTTKIVTSSTSASTPWRTSTPLITTTTTLSPSPATTTYQPPTSTVVSTTLLPNLWNQSTTTETTQLIESLENHTTTDNPSQYLSTSPTFNLTTTPTYTTSTTKTATTTSLSSTVTYNVSKTTLVATTTSTESPVTFVNTKTTTYMPTTINPTTKMQQTTTENPTTKMLRTTTENPTTKMVQTTTITPTTSTTHFGYSTTTLNTSTINKNGDSYDKNTVTTTAIPLVNRTRNLTNFLKKEGNIREEVVSSQFGIILISTIICLGIIFYVIYWMKKRHALQKENKKETTVLPTDEPLDPIIENILEEQDLKNQLRINSWRMAKLHKYLKKKYPEKTVLAKSMEDNVALMEKIHIQIKNSPVQIYKKRGKKKDSIPTLTADLIPKEDDIPTMKVDLMTALKEPEKVKHISSVAKLRIKMLPVEYEHRRKRKNFEPLKETLLPVESGTRRPRRKAPSPPKSELDVLKEKKLVSNSVFKKK